MPKLAVFPKAYVDQLCVDGSMTIRQWIELAATLGIDGLEFYPGFWNWLTRDRGASRARWRLITVL